MQDLTRMYELYNSLKKTCNSHEVEYIDLCVEKNYSQINI